jgi:hypothetical protein
MDRINRDTALVDVLISGYHHWFQVTPTTPVSRFPQYESLVAQQSSIGWDQQIFERLSTLCAAYQSNQDRTSVLPPLNLAMAGTDVLFLSSGPIAIITGSTKSSPPWP